MIIDFHTHVASARVIPPGFLDGWARNLGDQLQLGDGAESTARGLLEATLNDEDCTQLIEQMDSAGISKAVLLIIDFGFAFEDQAAQLETLHLLHRQIARATQRFEVFAGVDPRRGTAGVEFLERAVRDWSCAGFKIYPPCGYSPSDVRLDPFYEVCRSYRIPVLTHLGATSASLSFEHAVPLSVDAAARRFPGVDFVLAHAGTMYHEEAGLLAQYRPNVYLDVSGFQSQLSHGRFARKLRHLLESGLERKLLFGTDWPIHRLTGGQKEWTESFGKVLASLEVDAGVSEQIMYRNAERLLQKRGTA